jgi:hypothetical protein
MVISDDAAVYANFTQSQKCWAHFLRKAIKLTLMTGHGLPDDGRLSLLDRVIPVPDG